MGISIVIYNFWSATDAYATRQSVAGNSKFRGIVFCNLGSPPKTVISKFVTTRQIVAPDSSPCIYLMTTPTMFPRDKKKVFLKNVFIPF